MKSKKIWALLLAVAMVAIVFSGCSSTKNQKILRFGMTGYSGLFNPIMSDNVYDDYISSCIFEALNKVNVEGEVVPELATWEISEDKLTYTLTLKDGIKFSDGTAMTAEDVEFTYKTIAHPDYNGPRAYVVSSFVGYDAYHAGETDVFEGIKVIDEKTISFTYQEGLASPANAENFTYGIMSKKYYAFDKWEDFLAKNDKPLGSGIMVLDSWAEKEFVKLNKNTKYWDSANAAKIDGVLCTEVADTAILDALKTNQIDFGQLDLSLDNWNALKEMDNVTPISYLGNGYTFMCFDCTEAPFDDVKVRQAVMYALDRKTFIESCYGSTELASVGTAPISPTSWAYPDSGMNTYDYDPEKAAALLDEAGWIMGDDGYRYKDGEKFAINWLVYTDSAWPGILSEMAYDSWKQIGIDLTIDLMDFDTVAAKTMDAPVEEKAANFDIYTMGFSLNVDPDPTGALFDADAYSEGGYNASGYRNDHAQELMLKGKTEFDQAKRAEIYKEWAKLMNEEIPTVIVAYRNEIWGCNNRVKGMDLGTYADWAKVLRNITIEE